MSLQDEESLVNSFVAAGLFALLLSADPNTSLQSALVAAVPVAGFGVHEFLGDRVDLPDGSGGLVAGGSLVLVGGYGLVAQIDAIAGVGLVIGGSWFVLDGLTTITHESPSPEPAVIDGLENADPGALQDRMYTISAVYQGLREVNQPKTVEQLADSHGIERQQMVAIVTFLESKGKLEKFGTGYAAVESRWGRLEPVVAFCSWLPRRLVKPITRLAG